MSWQQRRVSSEALRDNPLGDPHERTVWVWSPADESRRYPSVYVLQGMTGMVDAWFNVEPFAVGYPARIEALAPEAVVVLVDAFTSLGGSQFVDSPAIGPYHTYLCDELVPYVDANFPTLAAREHRGVQGKSSGGYGAMVTPLLRPDLFGAIATHAGDALFEVCFARDFAPAARTLRDRYDGSVEAFVADFRSNPSLSSPDAHLLLNTYAMCAAYSANADGSIDLPFDLETGALVPEVWERWLALDPVLMARQPEHAETLRNLRAVWIDAGRSDDFCLDLGATAFHHEVVAAGTPADRVHYELFDGNHFGLTWRYPLSLSFLVDGLSSTL